MHSATLVAARGIPRVYCYQAPSTTVEFKPTRFVAIDEFLERKIEVIRAFASQVEIRDYLDEELLRATARYWARFSQARYVEPLEVVRDSDDAPAVATAAAEVPPMPLTCTRACSSPAPAARRASRSCAPWTASRVDAARGRHRPVRRRPLPRRRRPPRRSCRAATTRASSTRCSTLCRRDDDRRRSSRPSTPSCCRWRSARDEFAAAGTTLVLASVATLETCLDKWALRRALPRARARARDASSSTTRFDPAAIELPVIVKPRAGSGSRGIRLIERRAELEALRARRHAARAGAPARPRVLARRARARRRAASSPWSRASG